MKWSTEDLHTAELQIVFIHQDSYAELWILALCCHVMRAECSLTRSLQHWSRRFSMKGTLDPQGFLYSWDTGHRLQEMWDTHLLRHANLTSVETYCLSSHALLTFRFRFSESKTYGGMFSFLFLSFSPLATENRKRVLNRCNTQISTCIFFWLCFTWNYIWTK